MDSSNIAEFASPRYFDKLRSLNNVAGDAAAVAARAAGGSSTAAVTQTQITTQKQFSLPIHNSRPPKARRRRSNETTRSNDGPKRSKVLGPDLSFRAHRKPSFTSITHFKFSNPFHKDHHQQQTNHEPIPFVFEEPEVEVLPKPQQTLADRFFSLPNELQVNIVASLPMPTILNLRLTSRSFHDLVAINEAPIARHHLEHSVPDYAKTLYPVPLSERNTLQYLCGLWHRLHVAAKLTDVVAEHTTTEIFLQHTEAKRREFEPQHRRMKLRLMPLIFTMFHFFEKYRELHLQHLQAKGLPLNRQAYTLNPLERQIMNMYDDATLLRLHEVFPLVLSSFSRRLRPPSYVGTFERQLRGYHKDKPVDEIYATVLLVGGLRQAVKFWEIKGYNARRAAVDEWYNSVVKEPEHNHQGIQIPRARFAMLSIGRKKSNAASKQHEAEEEEKAHDWANCTEWDCVKHSCTPTLKPSVTPSSHPSLASHGSTTATTQPYLAIEPPMRPLPRDALRALLADQQPLNSIWLPTAEAVILERAIVESPSKIRRNQAVLRELIKENGGVDDEWAPGLSMAPRILVESFRGVDLRDDDGLLS